METDAFRLHNQAAYLYTTDLLKPGGILIAKGKHTCMCLDEGREVKQIDEVFPSEKAIGRVTAKDLSASVTTRKPVLRSESLTKTKL